MFLTKADELHNSEDDRGSACSDGDPSARTVSCPLLHGEPGQWLHEIGGCAVSAFFLRNTSSTASATKKEKETSGVA